jgi:hypothetical protein
LIRSGEPEGGGFISGLELLKIYPFRSPFTFVLGWPKFQQLDVATGFCGLHHVLIIQLNKRFLAMNDLWEFFDKHYQWVFSGLGIPLLIGLFTLFKKKKSSRLIQNQKSGVNSINIQGGRDVKFTQKNDE